MKKTVFPYLLLTGAAALGAGWPAATPAAPLDNTFTYQGRLLTTNCPANGRYDFSFSLFDANPGGSQVGSTFTTNQVVVTNGLFTASVNFGPVFNGTAYWLEIGVKTNGAPSFTTLPRQPLTPSPNALFAVKAGGLMVPGNTNSGGESFIGGGDGNSASGFASGISAGRNNRAGGNDSTVGGGFGNNASGNTATIGGGTFNISSGVGATVAGGRDNVAAGDYSFAAGLGAHASHKGSFVWADTVGGPLASTVSNQFLVRASGGFSVLGGDVGIGTSAPSFRLHVQGPGDVALGLGSTNLGGRTWTIQSSGANGLGDARDAGFQIIDRTALASRLAITTNGNVGIGTTAPGEQLELTGAAIIGNTTNAAPKAGAIRWTGLEFEGYNGTRWLSLTAPNADPLIVPATSMAFVSPGSFLMGSPPGEISRDPDETQHIVTLSKGFWMGKFEVMQGEYLSLMSTNPSYHAFNGGTNLSRPVENVAWNDANAYCAKLTQRERNAGRIPTNYVYRLPTEAEWEYAARGGTTTPFHLGNGLRSGQATFRGTQEYEVWVGSINNLDGLYLAETTTVGSYPPNGWGLHDMIGNVWELCQDWYGGYAPENVVDPQGPGSGTFHVMRGGGWSSSAVTCRSANRNGLNPDDRYDYVGFRVALALVQP